MHNPGNSCRGNASLCPLWRRAPAWPGHPVRRGLSAQALLPLEYWIARSSRATTPSVLF